MSSDGDEGGALPKGRVHHSHFEDFRRDPLAVVAGLTRSFDEPLSDETTQRMRAALEASPAEKHGGHRNDLDDLGAPPKVLHRRFARHRARFDAASG